MTAEEPHNGVPPRPGTTGRVRALLLDPGGHEAVDRVIRLVAVSLRVPCVTLGVAEFGRLHLVAGVGVPEPWLGLGYLPLEATFDRHVLRAGEPFVVEDATRHPIAVMVPRLENFSRVSYCGVPLRVDGDVVAVLGACGDEPRRWTQADVAALTELAAGLLRELETAASRAPPPLLLQQPDATVMVDASWRFTFASESAERLLERRREAIVGRAFWEVFAELIGTSFQQDIQRATFEGKAFDRDVFCAPLRKWLEMRSYPTSGGGAAIELRDVTARHRAEPGVGPSDDRYRRLFEESQTPLFVMSEEGRFVEVNRAFEAMLGLSRERIVSRSLTELGAPADAPDRLLKPLRDEGAVNDVEIVLRGADAREIVCAVTASAQLAGGVYHGTFRDVTTQKRSEAELVRSALQDPLTGLPNRLVFMDRLERLLTQAQRRPDYRFAVLFLDLDHFKQINDTHGHLFGDQLLISVARRLEGCLRQGDTVARMGGDEFAVLLDAISDSATVTWVIDRIKSELAEPFTMAGRTAHMTASIGIALTTGSHDTAEELLREADEAMYRAKASGRNSYVIYDAGMHQSALAQRQLEHDLREALQQQQLALHYLPVVELNGGTVTGLEALLRWAHPERGILMPADFMPLAEQTGLIIDIGWWVLREACRQLRAWQLDYPQAAFRLTMSVNLSAKQFVHPLLINKIDEILQETELAPEHLRLDMTESVVMHNVDLAQRLLKALRERGIQICIDNFGTGYSSIRQLREFPISSLKIDRSFVGTLSEERESREIVQSIIAIGHSMSIDAVAEGVETPEQLEQLRSLGTRFAQGFLFSLPLDSRAASRLLQRT